MPFCPTFLGMWGLLNKSEDSDITQWHSWLHIADDKDAAAAKDSITAFCDFGSN